MRRGKIVMQRIEKLANRQVSFSKRKKGLIKKAEELAVICDAEVGVIIFSETGKLYQYSNPRMETILARYNDVPESSELAIVETVASEESQTQVDALRAEVALLRRMQSELLAKDLESLNFSDLQQLEHMFNEGLLSVKDRMEKKVMIETKMLSEQVKELKRESAMKKNSVYEVGETSSRLGLPVDTNLKLGAPGAGNDAENPIHIE